MKKVFRFSIRVSKRKIRRKDSFLEEEKEEEEDEEKKVYKIDKALFLLSFFGFRSLSPNVDNSLYS